MSKTKTKSITPVSEGFTELPLSSLVLTDKNVRKIEPKHIDSLAESIMAVGLLQNLVVSPVADTNYFGVNAGKRRYMALSVLRDSGRIPEDYRVKVLIEEPGQATLASLTENYHRESMHPVDEFNAFSQLADEGLSVGEIALKFGVSELLVKQRLTLGRAAPELLGEYQNEKMNLEQLMVLCQVEDVERQIELWFGTSSWQRSASELRKLISNEAISVANKLVKFVGLDVYEGNGGSVQRDLFNEDDRYSYICDPQLINSLAIEKFKQMEQELIGQGWGWVKFSFDYDDSVIKGYGRCRPQDRDMTEAEQATWDLWDNRRIELEGILEGYYEEDSDFSDAQAEYDNLVTTMDTFQESLLDWGDIQGKAGVYLYLDYSGAIVRQEGLISKEIISQAASNDDAAGEGNSGLETGSSDSFSSSLLSYLACVRTSALQVELVKSPAIASVLMVHSLALTTFYGRWAKGGFFDIDLTTHSDEIKRTVTVFEDTPAGEYLSNIHALWQAKLPEDNNELLEYLFTLNADELQQLFAYCVGQSLNTHMVNQGAFAGYCKLSELLNLSIFKYWKPTKDNFFGRLKKAQIFSVLADAGVIFGDLDPSMKKDLIATQAEERIKTVPDWLPEQLRA